jgi:hypothetical protein
VRADASSNVQDRYHKLKHYTFVQVVIKELFTIIKQGVTSPDLSRIETAVSFLPITSSELKRVSRTRLRVAEKRTPGVRVYLKLL